MASDLYEKHQAQLVDIHNRWRDLPKLRVATGVDDAMNDWPIANFGEDDRLVGELSGKEKWLCTDHVRCSEFMLTSAECADVIAKAPDDIRALYKIIAELREALKESP